MSAAFDQDISEAKGDPTFSGDTFPLRFTVTDDGTSSGNAIDITGYTFEFALDDLDDNEQFSKTTAGGGVTITNASAGELEVTIAKTDTQDLAGHYLWELEAEAPNGGVQTIADGVWPITKDRVT